MNKRGVTIVEIIVSVGLISMILLFFFRLLVTLRNEDVRDKNTLLTINKTIISQNISNDFIERTLDVVSILGPNHIEFEFADGTNKMLVVTDDTLKYGDEGRKLTNAKYGKMSITNLEGIITVKIPVIMNGIENSNHTISLFYSAKGDSKGAPTVISSFNNDINNLDFYFYGTWTNQIVHVKGNAPDAVGYKISINGGVEEDLGVDEWYTLTGEGEIEVSLRKKLEDGNFSDPIVREIKIDKTDPICNSTSSVPVGTCSNENVTITGVCSDIGGSGCVENPTKQYSLNINSDTESPGTVYDYAGNSSVCPNINVFIDKNPPTCVSTGGNNQWTSSEVTITGICSDTGGSGCAGDVTKVYDFTTNSTIESPGYVSDNCGNIAPCPANITVRVDRSPPNISVSGNPTDWVNTNQTLTINASDAQSGIDNVAVNGTNVPIVNGIRTYTLTGNGIYTVSATDKAGNVATNIQTVTFIDKVPPSCVSSGGNDQWTATSRTLVGTCSDTISGCVNNTITKQYTTQISSTTETPGMVYDRAGNSTVCPANQTVRIDQTPPNCASSGGSDDWTNGSRTLLGTCTDAHSGCVSNVTKLYNEQINVINQSPGTVYDNVGNSRVCPANQTIRIDREAPTCVSTGGNTVWSNNPITITGVCSDTGGSGCIGDTTATFSNYTDTTTASPGPVVDRAGNSTMCPANRTVKVDPDMLTCASSGGSNDWTSGSRTLTGTCGTNGKSNCAGNVWKIYTSNINSTTESPGIVYDDIGNYKICPANQTVRIDKDAPSCSSTGGSSEWYTTNRTIRGNCSDGFSGCQTAQISRTFSTDRDDYYSPGSVCDLANNCVSCTSQRVRIDKTVPNNPSISNVSHVYCKTWLPGQPDPGYCWQFSIYCGYDALSGKDNLSCLQTCAFNSGSSCTPSNWGAEVINGKVTVAAKGVCARSRDIAGNISSTTCRSF